jgi:hypothetical protein
MITSIDDYKRQATSFSEMVGNLEGNLYAGEFKDRALVDKWYEHWTDLETVRARAGDSVAYSDVSDIVETMQQFLRDKLLERDQH